MHSFATSIHLWTASFDFWRLPTYMIPTRNWGNRAWLSQAWSAERREIDHTMKQTIIYVGGLLLLLSKAGILRNTASCHCPYSRRHWCVPAAEHCLLLQPLISNYKMPNSILTASLSPMLTASPFMLHGTPFRLFPPKPNLILAGK